MPDLLPDSRTRERRGSIRIGGANWVPVFCANCGVPWGRVPEENCSFACWLCNDCADKWGPVYGTLAMPDEVFWERVKQEQMARYGHLLTPEQLEQERIGGPSPLRTLLKEK